VVVSILLLPAAVTAQTDLCDDLSERLYGICTAYYAAGCDEDDTDSPRSNCRILTDVYYKLSGGTPPPWEAECPCTFDSILTVDPALITDVSCSSDDSRHGFDGVALAVYTLNQLQFTVTAQTWSTWSTPPRSVCFSGTWQDPAEWFEDLIVAEAAACAQRIDVITRSLSSDEENCEPIPDFEP
jgi:hypothetical protein